MACALALAITGCAGAAKKPLSGREKAELYVNVANGALLEGDPTAALHALLTAEEADPSLGDIFHSRAIAYEAKKEPEFAIREARKAVELMPKVAAAHNTLGKLLMDNGKTQEAIPHLMTAAKDPYYAEAYKPQTNLGILYYRQGDYAKASHYLMQASQTSPSSSCHAHYYMGHIRLRQGQMDLAIREYEKATDAFCARFVDAHFALGIAYERSRKFDNARKIYLSIRSSFPRTKFAEKAMERLRDIP